MKKSIPIVLIAIIAVTALFFVLSIPEKESNDHPYKDTPYAESIDAALAFLKARAQSNEAEWQVYAILDFLQRRFDLPPQYRFQSMISVENWSRDDEETKYYFKKLLDKNATFSCEEIKALKGAGQIEDYYYYMLSALHCNSCDIQEGFYEDLLAFLSWDQEEYGNPGYATTHAIIAFQWLQEQGCEDAHIHMDTQREHFASVLTSIIEREQSGTDLAFEAMAFLCYIGAKDRMRPNWLETMRNHQLLSGGWAWDAGKAPAGHPTILALWTLLEAAVPDNPQKPWTLKP